MQYCLGRQKGVKAELRGAAWQNIQCLRPRESAGPLWGSIPRLVYTEAIPYPFRCPPDDYRLLL